MENAGSSCSLHEFSDGTVHTKGVVLLRRVLRRSLGRVSVGTEVLRRVLRRAAVLRRQKHALQSTTPSACTP